MCGIKDVAVIADRERAVFKGPGKSLPVRLAFIQARPVPGMNDQLTEGIALVNVQNAGKLIGAVHAHPGLDRDLYRNGGKHPVQKGVQSVQIRQHPSPLVLGHHRARGASRVQVDLLIAQLPKLPGYSKKGLRAVG